MISISKLIGNTLRLIKWPLALVVIYFYPQIFFTFISAANDFIRNASPAFLIGALLFLFSIFNYSSKWLTFEHELAHYIFAKLTFKQKVKMEVYDDSQDGPFAGSCTWITHNEDDWLIFIAPYFFPTLTLSLSLFYLIPLDGISSVTVGPIYLNDIIIMILDFLVGFSIAFHLKSNIWELWYNFTTQKRKEEEIIGNDVASMGWPYALIMIPALNFIVFSYIFSVLTL
tara:strand:- start:2511 stop:3194 length:684 start_codon:yes stop_codon:yes gene_type:complete